MLEPCRRFNPRKEVPWIVGVFTVASNEYESVPAEEIRDRRAGQFVEPLRAMLLEGGEGELSDGRALRSSRRDVDFHDAPGFCQAAVPVPEENVEFLDLPDSGTGTAAWQKPGA